MILLQKNELPRIIKLVSSSNYASVYLLENGKYFKIFDYHFLKFLNIMGISIEHKILDAKPIETVPEIIVPEKAVYNGTNFEGYITGSAKGINYTEYDNTLSFSDKVNLEKYGREHIALENVIKRANKEGIVFPDLLTCENIFINNGHFQIIDYDGIQMPGYPPIELSSGLGDEAKYEVRKYRDANGMFTSNLDKKSLIYMYYLTAFNINLANVGMVNPYDGHIVALEEIFGLLGIDDQDFEHATWLAVSDKDHDNVYLDYLVLKLAEKYDLRVIGMTHNGLIKKLVKK